MKIGLVGYTGSGKSTLFQWVTGQTADPAQAHLAQSAMAEIPDPRLEGLYGIYNPKKRTRASLEITDMPGLARDHEGSAQKLAVIREAGLLVLVVAGHSGGDAAKDLATLEEDLLIADLDIVQRRVDKLRESLKKTRAGKDKEVLELEALEPVLAALDTGQPIRDMTLSPDHEKAIRSFQLFALKPKLAIINTADDEPLPESVTSKIPAGLDYVAIPLGLQLELAAMDADERQAFCEEMGVASHDAGALVLRLMDASGRMLFFTAGEDECRTWIIPKGATAVDAAGAIHTDLARGFIRAAVMSIDDLIRLGSEREIKAAGLVRQEHKGYVVQDGDIIEIRHNG